MKLPKPFLLKTDHIWFVLVACGLWSWFDGRSIEATILNSAAFIVLAIKVRNN